jgi:hypothetical protein
MSGIIPSYLTGRGSARLERTVRDREDGGSNPPAPTDEDTAGDKLGPFFYP